MVNGTFFDPIRSTLERSNLDLRKAADFVCALQFSCNWPATEAFDELKFVEQLEQIGPLHNAIFQAKDAGSSVAALCELFISAGHSTPRQTFSVWRLAFENKLINGVTYGAAMRCLLCLSTGDPTPWLAPGSRQGQWEVIAAIRDSDPAGLMREHELRQWQSLPERMTIYRGGCSDRATHEAALRHGSQGIFWTPNRQTARYYLANRCHQRRSEGHRGEWPFMVRAEVDRSAILGVGELGELTELFVDFDAIDPALVSCALPREVLAA